MRVMSSKENVKAKEHTNTEMETNMKDSGLIIIKKEKENSPMQELIQVKKEIFTQANSKKENSMVSDITSIANLENNTLVSGKKTNGVEKVNS